MITPKLDIRNINRMSLGRLTENQHDSLSPPSSQYTCNYVANLIPIPFQLRNFEIKYFISPSATFSAPGLEKDLSSFNNLSDPMNLTINVFCTSIKFWVIDKQIALVIITRKGGRPKLKMA